MVTKKGADHRDWLDQILPSHERLAPTAKLLVENILQKKKIEYLSVSARVKDLEAAIEKINRKEYASPQTQLTDLTGVRIITYLEEQVRDISAAIKDFFEIDEKNSLDRTEVLGDDRVGYRSTHFVCTLGKKRNSLPEYQSIGMLKFEIQVRTVLQHAWAELAHDRSFKFGAALPAAIQRKLNLYSGMLEIVDSAFDEISKDIDAYSRNLKNKSIEQISGAEINALTLNKLVSNLARLKGAKIKKLPIENDIIEELKHFGIKTIGELERLAMDPNVDPYLRTVSSTNYGVLRHILMYHDLNKYLGGPTPWAGIGESAVVLLATKYGREKVEEILYAAGKDILPED